MQLPCERDLLCGRLVSLRDRIGDRGERPALLTTRARSRMPGREDDAVLLGDLAYRSTEAHGDVVMDGDGGDLGDRRRGPQLLGADVGQTDMPDQPVLTHPGERIDYL